MRQFEAMGMRLFMQRMSVELRPTGLELFLACLKLVGPFTGKMNDENMRFYFV